MPITQDLHVLNSTAHLSRWAQLRRVVSNFFAWLAARLHASDDDTAEAPVTSGLLAWWQHALLAAGPDPKMSPDLYERLLAR